MTRKRIGIDAGGSLIKLAIEEDGRLHLKKYPLSRLDEVLSWLKLSAPDAEAALTGGKAATIRASFFPQGKVVSEFDAVCDGASYLMKRAGQSVPQKYILVSIGTGTSWYVVEGDHHKRLLGSGMGGGLFMGLGGLLSGKKEFHELEQLAENGEKGRVDLLVKDIYAPDEPPIDGNLTAANFAGTEIGKSAASDQLAALLNMMAETTLLLSAQAAALNQVDTVIFVGSIVSGSALFRSFLEKYAHMTGVKPLMVPEGEYSGAVGALLAH